MCRPARPGKPASAGFSLVETIAALGILSMAAIPLMQLSSDALRNEGRLESRLLARTTAENVLARAIASGVAPIIGRSTGSEAQLDRVYDWSLTIYSTDRPDLLRLEVSVSEAGHEQALARIVTLKAVPS